jgi:hypothetical protein
VTYDQTAQERLPRRMRDDTEIPVVDKGAIRKQLERDVQAFLEQGGRITVHGPEESGIEKAVFRSVDGHPRRKGSHWREVDVYGRPYEKKHQKEAK